MAAALAHAVILAHVLTASQCAASENPHWVAIVASKAGAQSVLNSTPGCAHWSLDQVLATPPTARPQHSSTSCHDVSVSEAFPGLRYGHNDHVSTHGVSNEPNHTRGLDILAAIHYCQVNIGRSVLFVNALRAAPALVDGWEP